MCVVVIQYDYFKKLREIADECCAYLWVDMAHIAGLVATGLHQSPEPYAHVVTSTKLKHYAALLAD